MKVYKKIVLLMVMLSIFLVNVQPAFAAPNKSLPGVPKGWTYRVDKGSSRGNENTHVHVDGPKKKQRYVEGFGGKNSHKSLPKLSGANKKIREAVKKTREYKKAEKDAKAEIKALKSIKAKKLNFSKASHRIIAIALVVLAGSTWFFPGDDAAAWVNLARVWSL